jgi:tetratricopeptide (TPR) repeat protein
LLVALEQAAALVSIASEQPLIPSGSGIRPAISERLASLDPQAAAASAANFKPTVPQIAVSEALAEAARIAFDADSAVPEHAAASGESAVAESGDLPVGEGADSAVGQSGRPSEGAGALRADRDETTRMVEAPAWESAPPFEGSSSSTAPLRVQRPAARLFVGLAGLAAMGAIAAAFLSCPPTQHSRRQPAPASAVARTATAAVPAAQLPPPAIEAPVIAVPAPKPPSRSELKHARRIAKRGDGYLRNDRPLTAAEAYLKALAIAPDYVPAIRPLAQIHLQRGNASEARRWTEHLAALEPDSAINQLLLGDAYALSDDQPRATEAWQLASTLGSAAARKRLAQQR